MFTIPCEAICNEHPAVYRSALVGVKGPGPKEIPVMIVEPNRRCDKQQLLADLRQLAAASELTNRIDHFLIKNEFPVDIRHNAKIFREKLAVWAAKKLAQAAA
jgi:acyl-coenzyme A synthetase/AMP-(fatty) acid ligase